MKISSKIKVLILGIGQSNFLDSLYGTILKQDSSFEFTVSDHNNFYKKVESEKDNISIYTNNLDLTHQKSKLKGFQLKRCLIKFVFSTIFWEIFFFQLSQKSSWKEIKEKWVSLVRTKYVVENFIEKDSYDWVQLHFCSPENVEWFYFLSDKFKKMASFWGSDLFRLTGPINVFYVSKALKKSEVITVQTIEMAEIICAKYGRELSDKIKDLRFIINPEIFEAINQFKNEENVLLSFKEKHQIPNDKVVVALGHNGFEANNHIKMILSLEKMSPEFKNKITFIIHLGYGLNHNYYNQLLEAIELQKSLNIVMIHELLDITEISKLRIITDVMVQAPVSDALSAAMTEVLYAGNKVIVGAWLPYGILRRNGVVFDEFENFSDLTDILVKNIKKEKSSNNMNKEVIESFLFPNKTTTEWIKVFRA